MAEVPHGTSSGYGYHRCRCDACMAFKSAQSRAQYERRVGRAVRVPKSPEQLAEENRARVKAWQAANPERKKALAARSRERNRESLRAKGRKRYAEMDDAARERHRESRRRWAKSPKGRAVARSRQNLRRRGVPYTAEAKAWIASLVDPVCAYCGAPATEIDHVIPITAGGTGELSNLVPACRPCNASKSNRSLEDFLTSKGVS